MYVLFFDILSCDSCFMKAKQLIIEKWINTEEDFTPEFKGKLTVIHVFQIHCQGCVVYAIPHAEELHRKFKDSIQLLGLHSVFEHHDVSGEEQLKKFMKEKNILYPVGIDKHIENHWMPETMKRYQLQGTPSTIIIDQNEEIILNHFGLYEPELMEKFIKEKL